MIAMIEILQAKDYAYVAGNGDICFDVHRFQGYGKLSHRNLTELQSGARIEIDETKRSPLDFVLWKLAKANEPSWDSPWGKGRPGWHIECSAMSTTILGQAFDIHGGGVDLKFPHHENEIAQAEGACEHQFVNLWMHVGHIQTGSEKMSKSLNNFLTIRDALAQFPAEVIRYFMVAGHYRSPISYTQDNLNQASQALARLYNALRGLPMKDAAGGAYREKFKATLADDFNTPEALAVLFELAREINRTRESGDIEQASALAAELRELGSVLGLLQQNPDQFLQGGDKVDAARIEALLVERQFARQQKDWAKADSIRQQLDEMNIVIEDSAQGPLWRKR
jgi:cysteinyl-tRNA synthetase